MPLAIAIDRARTDWLSGQPDAWTRYRACVRQVETSKPAPAGPPQQGVPIRPRAEA